MLYSKATPASQFSKPCRNDRRLVKYSNSKCSRKNPKAVVDVTRKSEKSRLSNIVPVTVVTKIEMICKAKAAWHTCTNCKKYYKISKHITVHTKTYRDARRSVSRSLAAASAAATHCRLPLYSYQSRVPTLIPPSPITPSRRAHGVSMMPCLQ